MSICTTKWLPSSVILWYGKQGPPFKRTVIAQLISDGHRPFPVASQTFFPVDSWESREGGAVAIALHCSLSLTRNRAADFQAGSSQMCSINGKALMCVDTYSCHCKTLSRQPRHSSKTVHSRSRQPHSRTGSRKSPPPSVAW